MDETIELVHESQLDGVYMMLNNAVAVGSHTITIKKTSKQRSNLMNASLHKYCAIVAEKMRDAGIDQRELIGTFKEGFTLPTQPHMIKDIFREVGRAMFKKNSTAKLNNSEMGMVYKVVDARLGEVVGITVPWPSNDPPMLGEGK